MQFVLLKDIAPQKGWVRGRPLDWPRQMITEMENQLREKHGWEPDEWRRFGDDPASIIAGLMKEEGQATQAEQAGSMVGVVEAPPENVDEIQKIDPPKAKRGRPKKTQEKAVA